MIGRGAGAAPAPARDTLTRGATKGIIGELDSTSPRLDGRLESTLNTPNTAFETLVTKDGAGALIARPLGASECSPSVKEQARTR